MVDDAYQKTGTTNSTAYPLLLHHYGTGSTQWDWVFVRKYTANEPAHSTWAAEQTIFSTTTGTWSSAADSFTISTSIASSVVSWNQTLNGGTITVDTKVGSNPWRTNVTNGASIQDLTDNMGITTIQVRANLSGSSTASPYLLDITKTVSLNSNFSSTGNRQKTVSISGASIVKNSTITWTSLVPANTTLTIQTSIDGGTSWQTCTNGQTIPGLTVGVSAAV